ncbi:unnamed protein product [Microthlaspi erraticum]|uniref:F-box domain-containing protein n=1 Tax=Microthlaspi erraticum TaxID=1685480 RepID=A0A6D2KTW1_9BRAS|nr:unnamed protein product [Microthlaspi erraticum]
MAVCTRSMMKNKTESTEAKANNQTYLNLPFDLTLLIMRRLSLKDNVRASVVCKAWQEACASVPVEEYPTPWLMHFPFLKEEYELYDPSLDKTHVFESPPEIRGSHIDCSKDGWLLMHKRSLNFFFNPFTQERIVLPWPHDRWGNHARAFSCAPTSNSCVILSICDINHNKSIFIQTYHLATKVCTPLVLPHPFPPKYAGFDHVVFSNGVFYCLTNIGVLGMFDLATNSWNALPGPPPNWGLDYYDKFMTEYQGDIFLIYTYKRKVKQVRYLKLDLTNRKWEEDEKRPKGLTCCLSFKSSLIVNKDLVHTRKLNQFNWNNVWIKLPINASYLFTS